MKAKALRRHQAILVYLYFVMDYMSHSDTFSPVAAKPKTTQTYAVVVIRSPSFDESSTSNKGGFIAIKVDQDIYEQHLSLYKHALIARLILAKGEKPWKLTDLK